jgi:hypothetical protein
MSHRRRQHNDGNTSSIHFDAAACELLTRFITNLYLHCGDICDGREFNVENSDDISPIIELCPHNYVDICDNSGSVNRNFDDGFSTIERDICDGSEFNVENSDDSSSIIELCPHNYVDICDNSGSVNRNFDDGFSAIELCQQDEAICDDSKVGIPIPASPLVNDDTAPSYSHIFQNKYTACSQRTQAASVAREEEISKMKPRQLRNQRDKVKKKLLTTAEKYISVVVPDHIQKNLISVDEIKKQVIVFDGGIENNPLLECPDGVNCWRSVRIADADGKHLQVVTADDPNKGLIHCAPNGDANFMLLSRRSAMDILPKKGFSGLFEAVRACEKAKGSTLTRGDAKKIFGDDINRSPRYNP